MEQRIITIDMLRQSNAILNDRRRAYANSMVNAISPAEFENPAGIALENEMAQAERALRIAFQHLRNAGALATAIDIMAGIDETALADLLDRTIGYDVNESARTLRFIMARLFPRANDGNGVPETIADLDDEDTCRGF